MLIVGSKCVTLRSFLFLSVFFVILVLHFALARPSSAYVGRKGVGVDANWATFRWEIEAFDEEIPRDFRAMGFAHVRVRA